MWTGLAEMREELAALRQRLEDPEEFLRERVAPALREAFAENLRAGGRPAYPPLADTTRAARTMDDRRPALPGNLPLAGGALEASFTQEGARGHIERVQGGTLEIGSAFPGVHERGGTRSYPIRPRQARALRYVGRTEQGIGWRMDRAVEHPPLPARPVLTLPEEVEERLERAGEEYLAG